MSTGLIARWLVHLSDPLGPRTPPPHRSLTPAQMRTLVSQAEMHGVLGCVLSNCKSHFENPEFAPAWSDARQRHRNAVGFSLMLQHHGEAVMGKMSVEGIPGIIVKGPVFARKLYPDRRLRQFTDIDFLVESAAVPQLGCLLAGQGFRLAAKSPVLDPQEWKWLHQDSPDLMIEVQCNLVHAASLRAASSITYADLAPSGLAADAECPAALLVIAAVHGGCGHQYERLQHVVDICQAARCVTTPDDERQLEILVARTGARPAAVIGLDLAGRLLGEPRCFDLAKALGPVRYGRPARALMSRSVVTSTKAGTRWVHSWRRAAYREMLKRPRRESRHKLSA